MLPRNRLRIEGELEDAARVLDVGGWASPWPRADVVLDLMPYETRGLYGETPDPEIERFDAETWVTHDICKHESWPFADNEFDYVVCSHTLEDVRDPVWVCEELSRVAKAGYVEVPSRLEEQSWGVHGPFVGWSHHHWLIDIDGAAGHLVFTGKPHAIHAAPGLSFPSAFGEQLSEEERVQWIDWEGEVTASEQFLFGDGELDAYLKQFVDQHRGMYPARQTGFRLRRLGWHGRRQRT